MKQLDFSAIGQRIREVRIGKGLTQEYLAEMTDVNVSHISNIETNKVKVSLTLLVNICNALDTTIDFILKPEYACSDSVLEQELLNITRTMDDTQKELLLRIAKVL